MGNDQDAPETVSGESLADAIRLDQFLKLVGASDTGGRAKVLVQDGHVMVNGSVELRRGRKLRHGDVIAVDGKSFTVDAESVG